MATCPVTPMMHAMISGTCCTHQSDSVARIPQQQTREFAIETTHDAFIDAFALA